MGKFKREFDLLKRDIGLATRKPRITLNGIFTDEQYAEALKLAASDPEKYSPKVIRIFVEDMSVKPEVIMARLKGNKS